MKSNRSERIGWYFYDWANSAFSTTVVTVFLGPYLTKIAEAGADASGYVSVFGIPVFSGSFFPYTVSISALLQVLLLPLLGALADYTNLKKQLLGFFAYLGAFATMGMYFLDGSRYLLGGSLFILANLCFGAAAVMYNAYLSDIASPERRDEVSSSGWAMGYLGGGILLALNLLLFSNAENLGISTGYAVRISLCSAGLWWALFTIIPMLTLKIRNPDSVLRRGDSYLKAGFRQLFETMKNIRKYPKTLMFLAGYLLYNDGVQAVIALSAQFGQQELGLEMAVLTQVILIVQFVAFGGALIFNYISRLVKTKGALLIAIAVWCGALIYAYGFLYTESGFYALGIIIGLIMGGTQALSRSLFSRLIPAGKEAEYFSLYEVSERGTSWLGPLLFGLSLQFTGSYRIAILSLIFFFISGFILLFKLNVENAEAELRIN